MPVVRFTTSPKLPHDLAHLRYVKGTEIEMTDDEANRWLRRGVAEIITLPRGRRAPQPPAEPKAVCPNCVADGDAKVCLGTDNPQCGQYVAAAYTATGGAGEDTAGGGAGGDTVTGGVGGDDAGKGEDTTSGAGDQSQSQPARHFARGSRR